MSEFMLAVGLLFKGYCGGHFGRDGYGDKRVEAFGADWIVVRNERGEKFFASFPDQAEMLRCVTDFVKEE